MRRSDPCLEEPVPPPRRAQGSPLANHLVLRVGSTVFQGGTSAQFTATNGGVLELCQNDVNTTDNTGGWGITIEVDELGPAI